MNLAWGADRMRALGIVIDGVRLVGGASGNALWRRVLADVLAAPIHGIQEPESGALGAAIQAYWTVLRASDNSVTADEVAQLFVHTTEQVVEPDPDSVAVYRELSNRFREAVRRVYL
jgi:xylulokinase